MTSIHIENATFNLPENVRIPALLTGEPTVKKLPAIGEHWPEQGGILAGVMPGQEGHPAYYLIVPTDTQAEAEDLKWGNHGHKYDDLSSWDGKANTEKLIESGNDHPAAEFCAALELNGFDDYYLPSRREASLIAATVPEATSSGWHWTSTQSSALGAFVQYFDVGGQHILNECSPHRVRAVRRLLIHSSI